MSLQVQYTASTDEGFRQRVAVALATAAVDIASEARGGQGQVTDAQHAIRQSWAVGVLQAPYAAAQKYTLGILTNATLAAKANDPKTITDSELQFTCNSLVNAFAGA